MGQFGRRTKELFRKDPDAADALVGAVCAWAGFAILILHAVRLVP